MLKKLITFFKEPPDMPVTKSKEEVDKDYSKFRQDIFVSSFVAYAFFHLCKKNISIVLPLLSSEYGYTNTQLGLLGSSLYLTYGVGKFVNGVIADRSNVRKFMPTALILSAICNICFALSAVFITPDKASFFGLPTLSVLLWLFAFFWGANGWFQSMGFPAVAKTLTFWFSNSERGTKWALWSCSHQFGTFLCAILSGFLAKYFGWKSAFIVPGIICILLSIWLYKKLRDRPRSLGLPDVEEYRNEPKAQTEPEDERSHWQIFKQYILKNPTMWMLAIAYIFVYIIRFGTEDWIVKYLVETRGNPIELATSKLSSLALCGVAGAILAGVISDKFFKGKRAIVNIIYLIGVAVCIFLLKYSNNIADFAIVGLIGAFTAGPQMMIGGLCAVESASKKVASAATGFTGIFGYVGAFLSSAGTGIIVDKFSWDGALIFWIISAMLCLVICTILFVKENKDGARRDCY